MTDATHIAAAAERNLQTRPKVSPLARKGGLKAGEGRFGMLLLLPAVAAFCLVVLKPFIEALLLSFQRFTIEMSEPRWIGLSNYRRVLSDDLMLGSFVTTAIFVAAATFFSIALGLAWAILLNQPFRGRDTLRGLSLLPWVMPAVVASFL
jgi:multiple sugar transport system permease protein